MNLKITKTIVLKSVLVSFYLLYFNCICYFLLLALLFHIALTLFQSISMSMYHICPHGYLFTLCLFVCPFLFSHILFLQFWTSANQVQRKESLVKASFKELCLVRLNLLLVKFEKNLNKQTVRLYQIVNNNELHIK